MTVESAISSHALQRLQERVRREIPERYHYPRVLAVLALQEEVAELIEALLNSQFTLKDGGAINSELGDVLLSCIEIANAYQLEISPPNRLEHGDDDAIAARLCVAAGKVSKECLEIEGFEQPRREQLLASLNQLIGETASLAVCLKIDLVKAFETKFGKILSKIEDGTWHHLYGDLLVNKRSKFD